MWLFNDAGCRLETLDPLERSLVEDLRELGRKHNVINLHSTEEDLRRRILDAVQGSVEIMKHAWKEGDFADFKTLWRRIT